MASDGGLIVSWQMRDDPLVRMPAYCPQVVCNDRRQRMATQNDLLFHKLSIRAGPASGNTLSRTPLWDRPLSLGHAPPLAIYTPGQLVHCHLSSNRYCRKNDEYFFPYDSPHSLLLGFRLLLLHWNHFQSFFAFDLDCLKKLIRHMFTIFFIQLSPECFLTI